LIHGKGTSIQETAWAYYNATNESPQVSASISNYFVGKVAYTTDLQKMLIAVIFFGWYNQ